MAVALLAVAPAALAEEGKGESLSLDYQAAAECPSQSHFERAVHELSTRVRWAPRAAERRHVEVRLERRDEQHSHGGLRLSEAAAAPGAPAERSFDGKTCQEVMEAAALATALLVDPELAGAPQPVSLAEDGNDDAVPIAAAPGATAAAAEPQPSPVDWALFAEANGRFGMGTPALVFAVGVESRLHLSGLEPSIQLGLGYSGNFIDGARPLALDWLPLGQLTVCPHWLGRGPGSRLSASICIEGEVGSLRSEAVPGGDPLPSALRPWGAAAVGLKLRWTPPALSLELSGGMLVPLVDQSYFALSGGEEQLLLRIVPAPVCFAGLSVFYDP